MATKDQRKAALKAGTAPHTTRHLVAKTLAAATSRAARDGDTKGVESRQALLAGLGYVLKIQFGKGRCARNVFSTLSFVAADFYPSPEADDAALAQAKRDEAERQAREEMRLAAIRARPLAQVVGLRRAEQAKP